MKVLENKLLLEKLLRSLGLGDVDGEPAALSGGLMHRMYALETSNGRYVVKALNPEIMRRPEAMRNYVASERIASFAADRIPAIAALQFGGEAIQEMEGRYFLVFDWTEGRTLKLNEINPGHCGKMGALLARLHGIDFTELDIANNSSGPRNLIDWSLYLQQGQENNAEWVGLLSENIENLKLWNAVANKAAEALESNRLITHGDLDPKNVMWYRDEPVLIDWESAGYRNPMQDLVETALYWSESETGHIDHARFTAFISAYKQHKDSLKADWSLVLASGFSGKLDWLEYSFKRSLRIECADDADQQTGTEQVQGTIEAIRNYAATIQEVGKWLNDES